MRWDKEISNIFSCSLKGRRALLTTSRFDEIHVSGYILLMLTAPHSNNLIINSYLILMIVPHDIIETIVS